MGSNSLPSSPLTHRNLERLELKSPLFRSMPLLQSNSFKAPLIPRNPSSDLMRTRLDSLEEEQSSLANSIHSNVPFLSRPFSRLGMVFPATGPLRSISSSASSPELLVPGPSRSPLMEQEMYSHHNHHDTTPLSFSPRSTRVAPLSSTSLHTLSSALPSPARAQSPPSAVALSVSQTCPPLEFPTQVLRSQSQQSSKDAKEQFPVLSSHLPSRHHTFYMKNDMVVLQVENTLYCLPSYTLCRESLHFRLLLSNRGEHGSTDEVPILLPNVMKESFDTLLHFLYHSVYEPESVTLGEWATILAVSTQLQFDRIRKTSIREISSRLSSVSAVTAIVLANRYGVQSWLAPAYSELCRRSDPLADDEAEELGATLTARVGRAREAVHRALYQKTYATQWPTDGHNIDDSILARVIRQVFGCD
ncbi:unnamed protein product [Somion occarium]|uniref:BTB domain-containing protein n=1 Tax=Somion occarium TaxID=3059160 RepID=A0ABP1DSH1_9APHY